MDYRQKIAALEAEEREWPYPARRLRTDETEQVRLLLTGLREEHRIPFLIVNHLDLLQEWKQGEDTDHFFITPHDHLRYSPKFCRYLQEEVPGGRRLCQESTLTQVKDCLLTNSLGLEPIKWLRKCHMGLRSIYYPIYFEKRPLAYCTGGKFSLPDDLETIAQRISGLQKELPGIEDKHLVALRDLVSHIRINTPEEVDGLNKNIKTGIYSLTTILKTKYLKNKRDWNRYFREKIEHYFDRIQIKDYRELPPELNKAFDGMMGYLGTEYIAFFISNKPESYLLDLISQCGLKGVGRADIFLNLRKAGLKREDITIYNWEYPHSDKKMDELRKGIRGIKKFKFMNMAHLFPFTFAGHYGAVVLGPFGREVEVSKEREWLNKICYTLGFRLLNLAVINTLKEEKRDRDLVVALVAHAVRQNLHNVEAELGEIKYEVCQSNHSFTQIKTSVVEAVARAEKGIDTLVRSCQTALDAPDAAKTLSLGLQEEHLYFQPLNLYELIIERTEKFRPKAEGRITGIKVDEYILPDLPGIMADREVLGLALDNLLENAIKYTGRNHYVDIKGVEVRGANKIILEIRNRGLEIKQWELDRIFEIGYRGEAPRKYYSEGGHGLGLAQVRRIIELHQGRIFCTCEQKGEGDWDYITTFTITFPTRVSFILETNK
jgi:signal transduction histidine kinase